MNNLKKYIILLFLPNIQESFFNDDIYYTTLHGNIFDLRYEKLHDYFKNMTQQMHTSTSEIQRTNEHQSTLPFYCTSLPKAKDSSDYTIYENV